METKFFDSLYEGDSPTGVKLCMSITGGDFWARVGGCLNLYCQQDEITSDPDNIVAVLDDSCVTVNVGEPVGIAAGDEYYYMIRSVNRCGDEADDLQSAVKVVFDETGEPLSSFGNALFGAEIKRVEGQRTQVKWLYCPTSSEQECLYFSIYSDGGTGEINFDQAVGQIYYRGCGVYVYESEAVSEGLNMFCISAHLKSGVEDIMSNKLVVDASSSPVSGLLIMSAELI